MLVCCAALTVLAASPTSSFAVSGAASRLGLVPIAPGGSADDPPEYGAGEVERLSFGIFIDPDLRGADPEDYLRERAELCVAGYGVQLFERDQRDAATRASSLLLQEDDGTIRLDTEALKPGVVYGWRVVAALPEGSTVLSSSLYFSVAAAEDLGGTGATPVSGLDAYAAPWPLSPSRLQQLTLQQRREARALSASLEGIVAFETYPTASDSYVCAPLRGGLLPLPPQLSASRMPAQILPLLGGLMQQAQAAQDALRSSGEWTDESRALVAQLGQLIGSVSYGRALTGRAPGLAGIVERLGRAAGDPGQAVALLSELRLALDSAVGYGSLDLRQGYEQAFAAYAESAEQRLAAVAELEMLRALFGDAGATELLSLVNDQRGALALLRDEVERGRLSKSQLAQRLAAQSRRAGEATIYGWEHIDGALCRPMPDAKPGPQLEQELTRCGLYRLLNAVWAD